MAKCNSTATSAVDRLAAQAAKGMFYGIERCIQQSVANTGDLDLAAVAAVIERHMTEKPKPGFILALAEYLAIAVESNILDLGTWKPLEGLRQ